MAQKIVLHTNWCPKCEVLEKKLTAKNIPYLTNTDTDYVVSRGHFYMPVLEVDGELYEFAAAVKWVNEQPAINSESE